VDQEISITRTPRGTNLPRSLNVSMGVLKFRTVIQIKSVTSIEMVRVGLFFARIQSDLFGSIMRGYAWRFKWKGISQLSGIIKHRGA
jgi:hypothetical protein